MLFLDKQHDPCRNKELIDKFSPGLDTKTLAEETDRLFNERRTPSGPGHSGKTPDYGKGFFKKLIKAAENLILTADRNNEETDSTIVDESGIAFPLWKKKLDQEYTRLYHALEKEVCVKECGAAGDGITDDTEAFRRAIGRGKAKVSIPAGTYLVSGIQLPSWTLLQGEGKGLTVIKLLDQSPKAARLVTNSNHWKGNHHILVRNLSLDWNVERLGNAAKTSTWGNHSSCLTYANVMYGWVKNVEAINPGLHCFDISSTLYNYSGDGYRARGGSRYVWLDKLNGYGFGDDGITTHHSDNILISNCHMCDPSGRTHKKGFSNSNGIEVDDGSRNVWLVNNSSARCFGGVEIKAHHNSSAASDVQIIGHLSVNDNRSFNFRHIGHHKAGDPESQTARNIRATKIVSIHPVHTDLYAGSAPRGLVVSAYKNVVINQFTLIGDPEYDYAGNPIIAIQYRARNVVLNRLAIQGFKQAGVDIKVFGGAQRADHVEISKASIQGSAKQGIQIGEGIRHVSVSEVRAEGENGRFGLADNSEHASIEDVHAEGYKTPVSVGGKKHGMA
ncbi:MULTISPECIES: glycoside hydrolase family 55 protein [Bacillus]|uniref:glycoside hydrolase family 55 protein n=1 Tax=Bacillus TaxID=1386 RepID=UPI001CD261FE|nr:MULTISPECIES: glycoside hydrolase family 55 protein [Bacillus]MCA1037347.1 glycoside hydrolase family 55 protein [Bacillus infantis]